MKYENLKRISTDLKSCETYYGCKYEFWDHNVSIVFGYRFMFKDIIDKFER